MKLLFAQVELPAGEEIRRVAVEVASRPHFQLDSPPADGSEPMWMRLLRLIIKPFAALFRMLDGLPESLRWLIVIGAVILLVALIAHIVYTLVNAVRGPMGRSARGFNPPDPKADPAALERAATAQAERGDFIGAIRLLMKAALRRLELAEKKAFRPGITNRQLLRQYQSSGLSAPLRWFVEAIDRKWYGGEPCGEADYAAGREHHAEICHYVAESRRAVGA